MDLFVKLRACFQNLSTIARKAKVAAVDELLQKAISEPLETRTMLTAVSLSGDAGATSIDIFNNAGTVEFFQNEPTTATPTVSVPYTDLGPINITGGGPTTITLDFSGGDVAPAGLTFTGQSSAFSPNSINVIGLPSASDVLGNGTLAVSGTVPSAVNSLVDDAVTFTNVPVINLTSSANVEIASGAFTFNTDFGDTNLTVDSGASVAFATSQHLNSLSIAASASVSMVPAGGLMLDTNTLSVQGTLDLTDNDMVVNAPSSSAMTTLQEQVADGLNGTTTAGGGIIESSTALQDSNMTIGVAPAAALATMNQPLAILDGQGIDPQNALIFRYVLKGDANLDGLVNSSDFQDMLIYFNTSPGTSPPAYYHGDFNYNGTVDDSDFQDLLINYNVQSSPTPSTVYAGASFQVSLPTTYNNVAIQRWDFNWGDGSFDSYGQGTTASSHVYTTTGNMLIQMSGICANGTVDRPAAIWLVVSPGTSTTVSINTAVNNDDNFTIASDGNGNTLFTETDDTGNVVNQWTALTSSLLSLSISGDAEGTTTVDFTNGNPLPASGLSLDSTQVNFVNGPQSTAGYSSLITSTTSALFSNGQTGGVEVRYPASTVVSDLNTLNQDAITAVAGTTTLGGAQPATGSDGPEVFVDSGATLLLSGSQRFSNLLILRQATARMEQDGSAVLETDNLVLYAKNIPNQFSGSVLDLADNAMIVHGGNYNSIAQYLANGYDNGKWDGETASGGLTPASIISSVAAADTTQTQALGYAQIGSLTTVGQLDLSSFDGTAVSPGDVVVAFTTYGDANLDGTVDLIDLAALKNGAANNLSGWSNGCFDYGGSTDEYDTNLFENVSVNAPTDLSAVEMYTGEVDLNWLDNNQGEVCHSLTLSRNGEVVATYTLAPGVDQYGVSGLVPDQVYSFSLSAFDNFSDGSQLSSGTDTANFTSPAIDISVQGPNTVAEGDVGDMLLLSSGTDSNLTTWQIVWTDESGGFISLDTVAGTGGEDPLPRLSMGLLSAAITVTDADNFTFSLPPISFEVAPRAPSDLEALAVSSTEIDLQWTNNSSLDTGFDVLRSTDDGALWTNIADLAEGTTRYDDSTVAASGTYEYVVLADATAGSGINTIGASIAGIVATGVIPAAPTPAPPNTMVPKSAPAAPVTTPNGVPTISVLTDTVADSASISWSYVGNNDQGFELEVEDSTTGENFHIIGPPRGPVFATTPGGSGSAGILYPIIPGDVYNFRLRVDRTDGTVSDYVSASGSIALNDGINLSAKVVVQTDPDTGSPYDEVQVGWQATTGNTSVQLEVMSSFYPGSGWNSVWNGEVPEGSGMWPGDLSYQGSNSNPYIVNPGVRGPGTYTYRARTLDQNANWTKWSTTQQLIVGNIDDLLHPASGYYGVPHASVNGTTITVTWLAGDGGAKLLLAPEVSGIIVGDGELLPVISGTYDSATNLYTAVLTNEQPATTYDISDWEPYTVDGDGAPDTFKAFNTVVTTGGTPPGVTPTAPASLTATLGTSPLQVYLHWQNSSNNEAEFVLQECNNANFITGVTSIATFQTDITAYIDKSLTLGNMYFRVEAFNGNNASSWTNAHVLVHYFIRLKFDAFIPSTLGLPAVPAQPYNWGPEPFNALSHNYFGTDDRSAPGSLGTSRIYTEADIDTSSLGNSANQVLYSISCDPSHQTTTKTFPTIGPINVATATPSKKTSTTDPAPYSTDISVEADAAYPFTPYYLSPKIYIDVVWHLKIVAGTTVSVSVSGLTTKFPAFEALVDGSVIWSFSPPWGSAPGFGNLGTSNKTLVVTGSTTVNH